MGQVGGSAQVQVQANEIFGVIDYDENPAVPSRSGSTRWISNQGQHAANDGGKGATPHGSVENKLEASSRNIQNTQTPCTAEAPELLDVQCHPRSHGSPTTIIDEARAGP